MLRIRNLDAGYGKLRVLKNVSLHVDPGEIVTMIGANGAGKTTLLHTIIGLLRPMHGEISFQGQPCVRTPVGRLVAIGEVGLSGEVRRVPALGRRLAEAARLGFELAIVPTGSEGYRKAEVTLGGIDTRELSQQSMMANKVPGLYFIGEAVDVTGWLGGYNFQWAWASGVAAGQAV